MPRTFTRSAPRIVPIKNAMLAGAAAARPRAVRQPSANHPRRRADDVEQDAGLAAVPTKAAARSVGADERLMRDWPGGDDTRAKPTRAIPVWYSKPWLLAALWGRLPAAPRD